MATRRHSTMTGTDHHSPGYIAASDPGAIGAGILWIDTSTTPHSLKKRNAGNTGWDHVGLVIGSGATDASAGNHAHSEGDVSGLVTDLSGKAALSHSHVEGDVTSLTSDLAAKADTTGPTLDHPTISDYEDLTDQGSDPASPASGKHRFYSKSGGLHVKDSGGTVVGPLGTGGGGGGGGITGTDDARFVTGYNATGATLTKGTPVFSQGGDGSPAIPDIEAASAYDEAPVYGLVAADIADGADGLVQIEGVLGGLDTIAWPAASFLYVDAAGALTNSGPASAPQQLIGFVVTSHATTGSIRVHPERLSPIAHAHFDDRDGGKLPALRLTEQASVGASPAGTQYLWINSADHKLYRTNSAGVDTLIA